MVVLVSYDVKSDRDGPKRLRRVAKICRDYGQRVQYSIFECIVPPEKWVVMRARLIDEIDVKVDSLRFYFLGSSDNWKKRVEHIGAKAGIDQEGTLIV
ncbi:MAG: CRISPR-associated endonuclease Cas2 [Candidatus Electrothrix sp. AR3]|nr:CRISPR-associated endonuclease Cas2 [Candidatus Electrothrix sp. AR3]